MNMEMDGCGMFWRAEKVCHTKKSALILGATRNYLEREDEDVIIRSRNTNRTVPYHSINFVSMFWTVPTVWAASY